MKKRYFIVILLWIAFACKETNNTSADSKNEKRQSGNLNAKDSIKTILPQKRTFLSEKDSLNYALALSQKQVFEQAQKDFANNNISAATKKYKSLIDKSAISDRLLVELAKKYVTIQDPFTLYITKKLKQDKTNTYSSTAFLIEASYYKHQSNHKKALEILDESIQKKWSFIEAFIAKGIIYFDMNKLDTAYKIFKKAAIVNNHHPKVYYWLARCEQAKGKKNKAITNYRRALLFDYNMEDAKKRIEQLTSK